MTLGPQSFNADSVRTPPGYSHAMRAGGLLFVAGQVPLDDEGVLVGPGDMAAQARQAFRNLGAVLAAAGAGWVDLVKLTYFVTDIAHVAAIREARDEFINVANPPASTLVEVVPALPAGHPHRDRSSRRRAVTSPPLTVTVPAATPSAPPGPVVAQDNRSRKSRERCTTRAVASAS